MRSATEALSTMRCSHIYLRSVGSTSISPAITSGARAPASDAGGGVDEELVIGQCPRLRSTRGGAIEALTADAARARFRRTRSDMRR